MQYLRLPNHDAGTTLLETHVPTDQDPRLKKCWFSQWRIYSLLWNAEKKTKNKTIQNSHLTLGILLNSMQFYSMRSKIKINSQGPKWLKKPRADTAFSWKIMTSKDWGIWEGINIPLVWCLMQRTARFFPLISTPFSTSAEKASWNISPTVRNNDTKEAACEESDAESFLNDGSFSLGYEHEGEE